MPTETIPAPSRRTRSIVLAAPLAVLAAACGAASVDSALPPAQTVAVVFTASPDSVPSGQTAAFAATATGVADTAVTWSVSETAGCGSIGDAGLYSAPTVGAEITCHVVARSHAAPDASAMAAIRVVPPPVVAVAISPSSATVGSGQAQTFTATVTGSSDTAVAWSVLEASCGTVSGGTYTAPAVASATTCHVVATSHADASKTATATVSITAAPQVAITISPTTPSVVGGRTQAFTATVTGASDTAVTWSVREASGCGSVSAGTYAAPVVASPVTCHVVATSHADASKTATATVSVTTTPQAAAPTFSPVAGTYTGSVTVTLASATSGATIRYTTDGSTPTASSTRYAAPFTLSATATVRAFAQAASLRDSAASAAAYTITAAPVVSVSISPSITTAVSGEVRIFTATVTGSSDTAVAWSVLEASGCGAVTPGGAWTAPTVTGAVTCHVVATSHADASRSATATITVSDSLDPELSILAGKAIFFGHQSVGAQIMAGVDRLLAASAGPKPVHASVSSSPAASDIAIGRWDEAYLGTNTQPLTKISAFQAVMLGAAGGALDALGAGKGIAFMKLCFVDVQSDDAALFAAYQAMVSTVTAARPGVRLVHVTMPLCGPGDSGNPMREAYNERVRAAYGGTVFDLARLESTDPSGNPVSGSYGPYAYPGYLDSDNCHLNTSGQDRMARALVQLLAN